MEFFDYNTYLLGAEEIYAMALQYKNGDGVERSDYTAAELFYKAAGKGSIRAKADFFEHLIMKPVYIPSGIAIEKDFFYTVVEE